MAINLSSSIVTNIMKKPLWLMERMLIIGSTVLFFWIFYMIFALPATYRAENWDVAWIGFDIGMLASILTTTWSVWKRRQLAIPALVISANFLVIDSWFDVATSQEGRDFWVALLLAGLVEIPSAFAFIRLARRLIRASIENTHKRLGLVPDSLSLRKVQLTFWVDDEI